MNRRPKPLAAEAVKLRRSWTLLVAFMAPLAQAAFLFLVVWLSDDRARQIGTGFQAWYQVNHAAWNLFVLPVAVALMTALSWGQEAEASAWKHLLVQPLPRQMHMRAKLAGLLGHLLAAQALLALLLLAGGLLLRAFVPQLAMGDLEPGRLARYTLLSTLGALPLAALHNALGGWASRVSLALVLALGGTWVATRLPAGPFLYLWPWGLCSRVPELGHQGHVPVAVLLALPAAAALALAGQAAFRRGEELP